MKKRKEGGREEERWMGKGGEKERMLGTRKTLKEKRTHAELSSTGSRNFDLQDVAAEASETEATRWLERRPSMELLRTGTARKVWR